MTEKGRPFPGTSPNDAGPYTDAEWRLIFQALTGSKTRRTTSGVLLGQGDGSLESLLVEETSPVSLAVVVRDGWAIVNGSLYENSPDGPDLTIPIPQNTDPADDRIDTIAIQLDINNAKTRVIRLAGTPAPVPVAPTLTQSATIFEIRITDITVESLDTDIVDADIDNTVRNYGILRQTKEGGTGIDADYTAGNLLVATGARTLVQLTTPPDFGALWGKTSETERMLWIDSRTAWIFTEVASNGIATAFAAETLDAFSDPSGNIVTSLVANQLLLAAGRYELVFGFAEIQRNTGAAFASWRLQNVTAASLISESNYAGAVTAAQTTRCLLQPIQFTMNGTDLIEFQARATLGVLSTGTPGALRAVNYTRGFALRKIG